MHTGGTKPRRVGRGRYALLRPQLHRALPPCVQQHGPALLNQQCWLWGCDVRRPEGNLLLEYGFARTRPPEGVTGSNAYTLVTPAGQQIVLWAFGLWYGDARGGLFVGRYQCLPLLAATATPPAAAFLPTHVTGVAVPGTAAEWRRGLLLLADALSWIAAYERWVLASVGLPYREACVNAWERGTCRVPPLQALHLWQEFATACRVHLASDVEKGGGTPTGADDDGSVFSTLVQR